jgi:hypothetical protein
LSTAWIIIENPDGVEKIQSLSWKVVKYPYFIVYQWGI